jgi:hypothetical protein
MRSGSWPGLLVYEPQSRSSLKGLTQPTLFGIGVGGKEEYFAKYLVHRKLRQAVAAGIILIGGKR